MNRLVFLSAVSLAVIGCNKKEAGEDDGLAPAKISQAAESAKPMLPPGHPPTGGANTAAGAGAEASAPAGSENTAAAAGKVLETMNAGGYTYVRLEGTGADEWAAAPETAVKVGDKVAYTGGMAMRDFHSPTLNRSFKVVYFVQGFSINGGPTSQGGAGAAGSKSAVPTPSPEPAKVDLSGIAKAEGGKTVSEVFAGKVGLSGKEVVVRAKVVKYNEGIMGRNWLHVRDGSGEDGSNDLTVTTSDQTSVGATVVVRGIVALDKDFGAGYKYDVIVENATLKSE